MSLISQPFSRVTCNSSTCPAKAELVRLRCTEGITFANPMLMTLRIQSHPHPVRVQRGDCDRLLYVRGLVPTNQSILVYPSELLRSLVTTTLFSSNTPQSQVSIRIRSEYMYTEIDGRTSTYTPRVFPWLPTVQVTILEPNSNHGSSSTLP